MQNAHKILGVKANADIDEIKRAFRRAAKRLHPDVAGGNAASTEQFLDLKKAYEALLERRKTAAELRHPPGKGTRTKPRPEPPRRLS